MSVMGYRFERREQASAWWQFGALILALLISVGFSAGLILIARANIGEAFAALLSGAFGSWKAFGETLVKATPLILTGLSVTVAFRAKIWSIGAEGQFVVGAMAGYWASVNLAFLPPGLLVISILGAAFIGGAFAGWIAGILKARMGADEVIITVMLNYVITFVLSYLLSEPWREQDQYYHMSPPVIEQAFFPPILANSRLHVGFLVALLATILVFWMIKKTRLGYELRAIGFNPKAAKFKGINVGRVTVMIMIISGGLAGLAGAGEVMGLHHRLKADIASGIGFVGIIIAMLAGLNPVGVIPAAILFGGLVNGANRMQILAGVPTALVYTIQAIVLLSVLATQTLATYRVRKVQND
jgi:general nucleoside transport system permease protein